MGSIDSAFRTSRPLLDHCALLRRVTFDLTGMPPTPQEQAAFLDDRRPDAYERLVDRLLASPAYGERVARRWMDAVHFAETHGHDQDRVREHAWPYRDYLIHSFNADTPYARFATEQLAADALQADGPLLPALGLLAAGPWDESSLRDIREDTLDRQIGRYLDRDDIVTTVMQEHSPAPPPNALAVTITNSTPFLRRTITLCKRSSLGRIEAIGLIRWERNRPTIGKKPNRAGMC
jgi:hypothetical protein